VPLCPCAAEKSSMQNAHGISENAKQKTKKACRFGKPLMLFRRFEPYQQLML
jgi:hypothetical protein